MKPPASVVERLVSYRSADLADPRYRDFLVASLLEEGTRAELAWLRSVIDDAELARWVEGHGTRRLSRRSRAFWSRLFRVSPPMPDALTRSLWPLA